jgi:hypothetical protein
VLGRQEQEAHAAQVGGMRQRRLERAAGGAAAGGVAVEAEDHASVKRNSFCTWSAVQAVPSVATALPKPVLRQRHHVHVALDDQRVALVAQRLAGLEQAVELAALAEHRRLRRVHVLGLAVVEHAAAEADDLAATARIGNITRSRNQS